MHKTYSIIRKGIAALAALWLGVTPFSSALAAATMEGQSWIDSLKFGGDIRLRHDTLDQAGGPVDRNRERFRLRFGTEATIQDFTAVLRLASGTGSQLSANQTEQSQFSQKPVWIDLAYLQWKPHEYIKLIGGRMANPFWLNYSSDLMWDPDLNPEGYAEKAEVPLSDRLKLFANFAQLPINEATGLTDKDPWVFGNQLGARATLFEETKLTVAASYYGFLNETVSPFGGAVITGATTDAQNPGNTRTASSDAGVLTSPYAIALFSGELAFHAGPIPLSLQGDFATNTSETTGTGRNGYQTGFVAGKASAAGTWEGAYFYKYLQNNATIANFADDDFGNGGTNRAGHIFWIAYSPRDYVQLKLKYYLTRVLDQTIGAAQDGIAFTGFNGDTNRLFLDVLVKF